MTPKQFKDKTRNLAREKQINPQIIQRYFMMEKFLEKIADSKYNEDFVLKGGFLIGSRYGIDKRSTVDIDTTFRHSKLTEEKLQEIFEDLTKIPTKEDISFELLQLKETREVDFYPGFQAKFVATLDNAKIPFKLDVTSGDSIYPSPPLHYHKLMFEDKEIKIPSYPTEQIIAEKLHATFIFGEDNSRMKDFYDLHVIPKLEKLDDKALYKSIKGTFKQRNTNYALKELHTQEMPTILQSDVLKNRWKDYQKENRYAENITFDETVTSIGNLLEKMIIQERKDQEREYNKQMKEIER